MQEIARLKGGKCLSKEYVNQNSPLQWMCKKGHTWDADYDLIRQGGWCMQCAKNTGKGQWLVFYQQLAQSKGGKLLSDKYINNFTLLKWQCAQGHVWKTTPKSVKDKDSWCPKCSYTAAAARRKTPIKELIALAVSLGGSLISKKYMDNKHPLQWQCRNGHRWFASSNGVKRGSWCPYCAGKATRTLEQMKEIARAKGGDCLSSEYVNQKTKLKWKCAQGHIWLTYPNYIVNHNGWCPYCSHRAKHSIEEMKKLATAKKGKCLSSVYVNSVTKLVWKCDKGHTWKTNPKNVIKGSWCPVCSHILKNHVNGRFISKKFPFVAS